MPAISWKSLVLLSVLFGLLVLNGCSGGLPEGFVLYEDESNGFAIGHPEPWEELHGMGTLVSFVAPGKSSQGRPNFGVTSENLGQDMTPAQYLEQARKVMQQVMPGFEFLGQQSETIDGRDAMRFKYSIAIDDQQLTLVGFAVIHEQMAYVVTGGCKDEQFADYESVFDLAGRSLRIL